MKVYKATLYDRDMGAVLSWFSSKQAAEAAVREHLKDIGESVGPSGIHAHDIPTDRAGLLHWLNNHFTRENG